MRSFLPLLLVITPALMAQDTPVNIDVRVSGLVLSNFFYNDHEVNNSDVPTIAGGVGVPGLPDRALGATVRQSMVRFTATMAGWAGGDLMAEIETDFFGGQQPSGGGRTHPLPRIRRAFVRMQWPSVSLLIGQESPPIVDVSPSSLASLGFPGFASAGNLWLWLPQIRVTGHLKQSDGIRLALEGAALAPNEGAAQQSGFTTQPDRAERSGRPSVEVRVVARWGSGDGAGELSLGGHYGWIALGADTMVDSRALAVSLRIPLARILELRGEGFTGQALHGLGGGGVGQNINLIGEPVETTGGWVQLLVRPGSRWEAGIGYGQDDPEDDPLLNILKNQVVSGHFHWRIAPVVFGLEYRHLKTTHAPVTGERSASQVNLAAGIEF
jgi:hypothetical protein